MPIKMGSSTLNNGGTAKWGSTALSSIKWGGTEVWKKEQCVLSNWSQNLWYIASAYQVADAYSSEFTVHASSFSQIRINGTLKSVVAGTAEYGTYGVAIDLQRKNGTTWETLRRMNATIWTSSGNKSCKEIYENSGKTTDNADFNAIAGALGGPVGGNNSAGTYTGTLNNTYNLKGVWNTYGLTSRGGLSLSGDITCRLRLWARCAASDQTAGFTGSCQNIYVYET